ncbi:hypothetical protein M378DRAFT_166997 [Amanita muscaria Koide BX008]|uniref:Uncharacterized protein n=1 Tax=Amanita muscaria (strain Koide BX008) TaxID=946122 RepID=A0A0C2WIJ5_AMAMK|nr:hypothetical protein M378DRAFT_166997 [Amanita muscaria Koide BX008]
MNVEYISLTREKVIDRNPIRKRHYACNITGYNCNLLQKASRTAETFDARSTVSTELNRHASSLFFAALGLHPLAEHHLCRRIWQPPAQILYGLLAVHFRSPSPRQHISKHHFHHFQFVSRKESARARMTTMPEQYIIGIQGCDLVFVLHSFSIPHLFEPEFMEGIWVGIIGVSRGDSVMHRGRTSKILMIRL